MSDSEKQEMEGLILQTLDKNGSIPDSLEFCKALNREAVRIAADGPSVLKHVASVYRSSLCFPSILP